MLFQFLCSAFIPIVAKQAPTSRSIELSVQHTSIVAPLLFKEKEENESAEFLSSANSAPLLDLSSHSSNLTASHDEMGLIDTSRVFYQSQRFTLFCKLLI